MQLFAQIGTYFLLMRRTFSRPEKFSILYRQTMREIEKVGINSFAIVVIISLFVGAVITIQTNFNIENPPCFQSTWLAYCAGFSACWNFHPPWWP